LGNYSDWGMPPLPLLSGAYSLYGRNCNNNNKNNSNLYTIKNNRNI